MRVWLVLVPVLAAGCAFNNGIAVRFDGSLPVTVVESFSAQITERHVSGVTTRVRQVVRIDCPLTVVYDVNEATGSAVLSQTLVTQLRSPRLRRGIRYDIDCTDPVVLELPAAATNLSATAISAAGVRTVLSLSAARGLRAERGTQIVSVRWPAELPSGDYDLELQLQMPDAQAFHEKAIYAASVTCGRRSYVKPILPALTNMAQIPPFVIDPSAGASMIILPHIAGANALHAQVTSRLRC